MAKERMQLAIHKDVDDVLNKVADKLDVTKGKAASDAIKEYAKKVLK